MERRTIFPDLVTVSLLICFRIVGVMTEASNHRYKPEEKVPPYANKVEPFHNPRFCDTVVKRKIIKIENEEEY
ncbi:hypothetical protein KFK09_011524 [Dendrobium nobile]|uniref:Uncharacterized protein n=1 Tax=Dendrobium nobile TaxID=94219 RepID=A0A8T3BEU0_DENNO|nr:hypothetical protein KFK09_011524 [Dendrobium nobile]